MGQDRALPGVQQRQDALRLAERVDAQNRVLSGGGGFGPPGVQLIGQHVLRRPAVDRQAEGAFADEGVAAHGLERGGEAVVHRLVVARDDPDLAADLDPDLRRAGDVARGMEADVAPPMRRSSPYSMVCRRISPRRWRMTGAAPEVAR
jgi:hypothetical protein